MDISEEFKTKLSDVMNLITHEALDELKNKEATNNYNQEITSNHNNQEIKENIENNQAEDSKAEDTTKNTTTDNINPITDNTTNTTTTSNISNKETIQLIETIIKENLDNYQIQGRIFNIINEKLSIETKKVLDNTKELFSTKARQEDKLSEFFNTNITNFKDKLDSYCRNSEEIKLENKNLLTKISELEEIVKTNNQLINEKQEEIDLLNNNLNVIDLKLEEKEKAIESLDNEVDELRKSIINEKEEKEQIYQQLTKINIDTKTEFHKSTTKISELDLKLKKLNENNDNLTSKLIEMEKNLNEILKKLEATSQKVVTYKHTLKQIFLIFLEEDIFIDKIEKCFKNSEEDADKFFDEVYKLSSYISPKFTLSVYKSLLNNEILNRLNKYNLEVDLDIIFNNKREFKSCEEFIETIDKVKNSFPIQKTIDELINYIEKLAKSIQTHLKQQNELKDTIKKLKDQLDESKKNDSDKSETLHKQLAKMQQDFKEFNKTEKLLKDTIETLENSLRDSKYETEKFSTRLKNQTKSNEELTKDFESYKEKCNLLTHKCDTFKLENAELIEKLMQKQDENSFESERTKQLLKDREALNSKTTELEQLKELLRSKIEMAATQEKEITSLKNSYRNLEDLMENIRSKEERTIEITKSELNQLKLKLEEQTTICRKQEELLITSEIERKEYQEIKEKLFYLEKDNIQIREQKDTIKKHAEGIVNKVKNDLKDTEFLIDKRIISDFLFKYFDKSKNEKLKLTLLDYFSNLMGYNNDERKIIGLPPSNFANNIKSNTESINSVKAITNQANDKLKEISDDLYNFILNG